MTLLHLVGHDATSGGDDALALARRIGAGRDVRRRIVHVLAFGGPTFEVGDAWLAAQSAAVREPFERIRASLEGDEVLELVFADSPARGLHDRAEDLGADLIVVGTHARGRLHRPLGSVADRLLSGGPCALAHAPVGYAAAGAPLARIVVGVDGSPEASGALHEAAAIAVTAGAMVDVVHAVDLATRGIGFTEAMFLPPADQDEARHAAGRQAAEALASLPESVRGVSAGRSGAAGSVIEAFAAEQGVQLVVLGSRGYGPVLRTLLGSTAAHLLHHTDLPVMVLPRGAHAAVTLGAHAFAAAP